MKEVYEKPVLKIERFENDDVIACSGVYLTTCSYDSYYGVERCS